MSAGWDMIYSTDLQFISLYVNILKTGGSPKLKTGGSPVTNILEVPKALIIEVDCGGLYT